MSINLEWDFSRLPISEHNLVLRLFREGQFSELIKLHNKYKLSKYEYCCEGQYEAIKKWIRYGISTNQIRSSKSLEVS